MKITLEVESELKRNDLLYFDGKCLKPITKSVLLEEVNEHIKTLYTAVADTNKNIENFKDGVNGKLKEYHNILQVLTKGDK